MMKCTHSDMHEHDAGELELVSRPVRADLGLFTAVMAYCAVFGDLFGPRLRVRLRPSAGCADTAGGIGPAGGRGSNRDDEFRASGGKLIR
jgi:hypothetical protein